MSPPATFQLLAPSPPFFPSSTQPTLHRPPSKAVTAVNRSAAQEEKQGSGRGFAEEHSQHDCRLTLFLGEPPPSPSLPCNLISRSSSLLWRQKAPSSSSPPPHPFPPPPPPSNPNSCSEDLPYSIVSSPFYDAQISLSPFPMLSYPHLLQLLRFSTTDCE